MHIMSLAVIAVMALWLWRPAADPIPTKEQEAKISDLAMLLAAPSSDAAVIDSRLQSFGMFPPDAKASGALAEAMTTCKTTGLDAPGREQLARQLYGITVVEDSTAEGLPSALLAIRQTIAAAGCSPAAVDAIVAAARAMASTDPKPRRNWW